MKCKITPIPPHYGEPAIIQPIEPATEEASIMMLEGTDNALIGLDLGFGNDTEVTNMVKNPFYRPFPSFLPLTKADIAHFKRIEKNMEKLKKSSEKDNDLCNTIIDAIVYSTKWEVKDGKLIISSKINYAKNIEKHESK